VLSQVTDPETLSEAKSSGAVGFLHKDLRVDEIAAALDVIAAGGRVPDPGVLGVRNRRQVRPDPGTPLDKLPPREKEIVTRIARGEDTRQMSLAMSVTAETVRTYVKNVLAKLGAHSRLQLAALASRDGWLTDQDPAVDVLGPAGQPITWSHGRSLPRNGSWHGDIDAGWVGAATDSSAHR
jgi:Response regulator containing a CheY-like receiver domain and an HTH DNA-binding domain